MYSISEALVEERSLEDSHLHNVEAAQVVHHTRKRVAVVET